MMILLIIIFVERSFFYFLILIISLEKVYLYFLKVRKRCFYVLKELNLVIF